MYPLIVVDTETTGLPPKRDPNDFSNVHLCRLSWLEVWDANRWNHRDHIVRLPAGVEIEPEASKVNGLTTEYVNRVGIDKHEAMRDLITSMKRIQAEHIVGHNYMGFDQHVLCNASREFAVHVCSLKPHDTMLYWNAFVSGARKPETVSHDYWLGQLYAARGRGSLATVAMAMLGARRAADTHDSVEDCRMCRDILVAMYARGILRDIAAMQGPLPKPVQP
jgi:DNA polymerase III epsilon subunit-like protein